MSDGRWDNCRNCRKPFFTYGKTNCRACELDPVIRCYICRKPATCSGELGKCCDDTRCHNADAYRAATQREMDEVNLMCNSY